jgi:hypothetical protein
MVKDCHIQREVEATECFSLLEAILDGALQICILMLTSESNNDKLFPNVIHALAIIVYGITVLAPRIDAHKAVDVLRGTYCMSCLGIVLCVDS